MRGKLLKSESIYKKWRKDVNLWEEKLLFFSLIHYYEYSIWKNGKVYKHIRFRRYSNPEYLDKAYETKVYIGKREFTEKYNSNKWAVPVNYEIDLSLP